MSDDKTAMVKDLSRHLSDKIELALSDYFDLCRRVHIDTETGMAFALTVLSEHLTVGAIAVEATETEFVHMCRWHFHKAIHHG